jgi:hypothetical protein
VSRSASRRGLSALLVLAFAAAALLLLQEQPAPSRAPAFSLAADGALTLQSDRHGVAILQAGGMRPGDVAEGAVTLSVSADAALSLRAEAGAEQAGTGGALLSERLALEIDDVSDPDQPARVYEGGLAGATAALAPLEAGTERRYRFRVTLPRGAGDNALQGAGLTTAFVWTAVASAAKEPTPTPTATPTPAPTTTPETPSTPPTPPSPPTGPATTADAARVTGLPATGGCVKRRRYSIGAKPRAGVRVTGLQVFVDNRKARAGRKARKVKLDLKKGKKPRVSVRVVVKTTAGNVTVARTYRLCRR